jgi:protein transport protein SEC31
VSDVAWHPENVSFGIPTLRRNLTRLDQATRLITASEDDSQSVIMLWDLRNARAPERILQGHERGAPSVSWYPQDPELVISSGKDNRTLV